MEKVPWKEARETLFAFLEKFPTMGQDVIDSAYLAGLDDTEAIRVAAKREESDKLKKNIGMLRQWLNEDRITNAGKMVSSEMLEHWLIGSRDVTE